MKSRQIALCGVLSALAVVILLAGGLVPIATFCAPLIAMGVLLPVLPECGAAAAGVAWAAVSLLALLLVPDREMALVYVCFGWYPILRPHLAAIRSKILRLAARLAVCDLTIALLYGVLIRLLGVSEAASELAGASPLLTAALLLGGNLVFFCMDLVLARLTLLWQRTLRRRLFRRS